MLRYPLSLAVPALLLVVTVLVLTLTLSAPLGGYGADNVFAYHPAFMSVAFLLLLPLGVLSYGVDLGEAGNAAYPDRDSRRVLHGVMNLFGACLAVCGYLVAFVYHAAKGKDLAGHLALNFNGGPAIPARTAHVFLGLVAVLGSIAMAASGLYKFVVVARDGHRRVFKWHAYAGPVVWGCGCVRAAGQLCARARARMHARAGAAAIGCSSSESRGCVCSPHTTRRRASPPPPSSPAALPPAPLRPSSPRAACFASAWRPISSSSRRTRARRATSPARTGAAAPSRPSCLASWPSPSASPCRAASATARTSWRAWRTRRTTAASAGCSTRRRKAKQTCESVWTCAKERYT